MKHTRHLISLAFAALALVCAADVTRDTEWQDVPPSTRVGTVVDLGQGGGGGITTNDVDGILASSNLVTYADGSFAEVDRNGIRLQSVYSDAASGGLFGIETNADITIHAAAFYDYGRRSAAVGMNVGVKHLEVAGRDNGVSRTARLTYDNTDIATAHMVTGITAAALAPIVTTQEQHTAQIALKANDSDVVKKGSFVDYGQCPVFDTLRIGERGGAYNQFSVEHGAGPYYCDLQMGQGAFRVHTLGNETYTAGRVIQFTVNGTNVMAEIASKASAASVYTRAETGLAVTNIVREIADYAVTAAVTNEVATAMNDLLGPNWRTTYGGGLVGVLAAIFAAIAVLKRDKLTKGLNAQGVPTDPNVSSLFTSANTSTDPQPSGLLQNATLDKGIVKVCNSIVGTPNATLESALSGGNA